MEVQRQTSKAPLQQKATQVRRETKQKIKSDVKQNHQRLELNKEFSSMPLKQKNCESPTDGRPWKRNFDTEVVPCKPNAKQTTNPITRAQQNNHLSPPL
jgi:hypothetical protein